MNPRVRIAVPAALVSVLALTALPAAGSESDGGQSQLGKINHIVVIYEENHSFDNLYGTWEGVNGRSNASAAKTLQIKQNGAVFACLLQDDVNLTSPTPLATTFQCPIFDRSLHPQGCPHLPATRSLRATWPDAQPGQPARRLH